MSHDHVNWFCLGLFLAGAVVCSNTLPETKGRAIGVVLIFLAALGVFAHILVLGVKITTLLGDTS